MAAPTPVPASVTLHDLSGTWQMDKTRSTGLEPAMQVQGMSWFLRKAIGVAVVTLSVKHTDPTISAESKGTGVPMTVTEDMTLDWTIRDKKLPIFGAVRSRCKRDTYPLAAGTEVATIAACDLDDADCAADADDLAWLGEGWLPDEGADAATRTLIEVQTRGTDAPWVSHQAWGFQLVEGQRTHVRKILVWKGQEKARAFTLYEYKGPLE